MKETNWRTVPMLLRASLAQPILGLCIKLALFITLHFVVCPLKGRNEKLLEKGRKQMMCKIAFQEKLSVKV